MKALKIGTELWPDDAAANLRALKRTVGGRIHDTTGSEKSMWVRIEKELENVDVQSLGFDHPICSGVFDTEFEPFNNIPTSFHDIFKQSFQKFKLKESEMVMDTCREFFDNLGNEEPMDVGLDNVIYGKWLDGSNKIQEMTKQILEAL